MERTYHAYLMLHILGTGIYEVRIMSSHFPAQCFKEGTWVSALEGLSSASYEEAKENLMQQLRRVSEFSPTHKIWLNMLERK